MIYVCSRCGEHHVGHCFVPVPAGRNGTPKYDGPDRNWIPLTLLILASVVVGLVVVLLAARPPAP